MRKLFKSAASRILIPITKWYLGQERNYTYKSIQIIVKPGVFHPGLFSSTLFILKYLERQNLSNQTLLELGCGSGLISIVASTRGAQVTASDLSEAAIKNTSTNAEQNNCTINLVHSDLFDKINKTQFDWIIINPPYYNKAVTNESELAWHCGVNFQYFHKLFFSLSEFMNARTTVIMVLTLGCDLEQIQKIGTGKGFEFSLIEEKNVLFDGKDYLYQIKTIV
jgi:release factor glutamine methyltransferase